MFESSIASVDDVISIIPQLTNKLTLTFYPGVDEDVKREFCVKLKEEITKIDSTKIQSQVKFSTFLFQNKNQYFLIFS